MMLTCTEGSEMGVVGGRWVGHGTFTSGVQVAKVERQTLDFVGGHSVFVPEDLVVRRFHCALCVEGKKF